jgi:hypothetical protein
MKRLRPKSAQSMKSLETCEQISPDVANSLRCADGRVERLCIERFKALQYHDGGVFVGGGGEEQTNQRLRIFGLNLGTILKG